MKGLQSTQPGDIVKYLFKYGYVTEGTKGIGTETEFGTDQPRCLVSWEGDTGGDDDNIEDPIILAYGETSGIWHGDTGIGGIELVCRPQWIGREDTCQQELKYENYPTKGKGHPTYCGIDHADWWVKKIYVTLKLLSQNTTARRVLNLLKGK